MHGIDFLGSLMKLVYHICEKTAAGGRNPVSHVSGEFNIWLGNFFEKVKIPVSKCKY